MRVPYEYAVIQAVPRVERGELINVGVVLYCQLRDFLAARTHLDAERLLALDPDADLDAIRAALTAWEATCTEHDATRGMTLGERFRWLVAPRSTILRAGPVHMGLAEDPQTELDRLVTLLVR
jgi:hypothetical protein